MRRSIIFFCGVLTLPAALLFAGDLSLDGISYDAADPSASIAVINGEVVTEGQSVAGCRVVRITQEKVELRQTATGETVALSLSAHRSTGGSASGGAAKKTGDKGAPARALTKDEEQLVKHANFWDSIKTYVEGMTSSFGGPMGTYKEFAESMFNGKFDQAREKVEGSSAKNQLASRQKFFEGCRASYGNHLSHTSFKLVSQKDLGDGQMELEVDQIARGDPPGITSAYGSTLVAFKHKAVMVKTDQGWRVKSFQLHSVPNKMYMVPWLCFE